MFFSALLKALELVNCATSLTPERQDAVKVEIHINLDGIAALQSAEPTSNKSEPLVGVPEVSYGANDVMTQSTKAVALKLDDEQGRHLVVILGTQGFCQKKN